MKLSWWQNLLIFVFIGLMVLFCLNWKAILTSHIFYEILFGVILLGFLFFKVIGAVDLPVKQYSANMSGRDYEKYVAYQLSRSGFTNVLVTPESGDFGADVTAVDKDGVKVCVQCKKYSKPVGVKAVQEVIGAKAYYGCPRAMVITTSTFTPAAKELAGRSGVKLIEEFYPKTNWDDEELDWELDE